MSDVIPAPEAVKSESTPAPVAVKTDTPTQDASTPEAPKADGSEQPELHEEKKEPTPGEIARKERNRQRWQAMKEERQAALSEAARLRAELDRLKSTSVDYSNIEDPDEALALRTAQKMREMSAETYDQQVKAQHKRANEAVVEAWSAIREDARERMPDFDQVVNDDTPIHPSAAPFIVESEKAAEIAYYLGKNPDVARDLYVDFERNPAKALIRLGQIDAKVSAPASKPVSSAPKPAPILSGSASPPAFDPASAGVSDMQAMLRKVGVLR